MTHEHEQPEYKHARQVFGLTENESLYYRVSDHRFQHLLSDPDTNIHAVSLDSNSYGEFLFVTLSREVHGKRYGITFYGLGFHEPREQWYTDEWYWYENHPIDSVYRRTLPKAAAQQLIQERRDEIAPFITHDAPSDRAVLFAILADMTDEDGALAEMEDLPELDNLPFDDEE